MQLNLKKKYLPILFGAFTLLLFAGKPYLLDLIFPSKSIGQMVGENAKDIIDSLNGNSTVKTRSPRNTWSNIIMILSLVSFIATAIFSYMASENVATKKFGIIGGTLATLGLLFYFFHLVIGTIGFIILVLLIFAVLFTLDGL